MIERDDCSDTRDLLDTPLAERAMQSNEVDGSEGRNRKRDSRARDQGNAEGYHGWEISAAKDLGVLRILYFDNSCYVFCFSTYTSFLYRNFHISNVDAYMHFALLHIEEKNAYQYLFLSIQICMSS